MSTPTDVALTSEAAERAIPELMSYFHDLIPLNLGPQGQTYGTEQMSRADRILAFLERQETGALDALRVISPKWYATLLRQFEDDVAHSPMFGHTKGDQSIRDSASPLEGVI